MLPAAYLELLQSLIRCVPVTADIPSVNEASRLMEEFLLSHGVRVVREEIDGRHTLYASALATGKSTEVLFNAHLDVVPLTVPTQSEPVIRENRLYGRGAVDCLGSCVAIARILCENPGKSVGAIFTTNEEKGGSTTFEMLQRGYRATRGAVILDSLRNDGIGVAEKGLLDVEMTAHGVGGHAAYPWNSKNALDILQEAYGKLRQAWSNPTQVDNWQDSCSAVGISCSSSAHNTIPDAATILLNIRYTSPDGIQTIPEKIRSITGLDDVRVVNSCLPVFTNENHPFVQQIKNCKKRILGQGIPCFRMNGATDARHFARVVPELPVVLDGPVGGNPHAENEWVDLNAIEQIAQIYSEIL